MLDKTKAIAALVRDGISDPDRLEGLTKDSSGVIEFVDIVAREFQLSHDNLLATVSESNSVKYSDGPSVVRSSMVDKLASLELFKRFWVVPFLVVDGRLQISTLDPYSDGVISKLKSALVGYGIDMVQVSRSSMVEIATSIFGSAISKEFEESNPLSQGESDSKSIGVSDRLVSMARMDASIPSIAELLRVTSDQRGSDLHLTVGASPTIRVDGRLIRLDQYPILKPQTIRELIYSILTDSQRDRFEASRELDVSYGVAGIGRFRVNVFMQRSSLGAVMRSIPDKIATLESLGLPKVVSSFADIPRGLVLVTGPTGSGKSTTLASLVDSINASRECHIVTVEDPIEFLHSHKKALINQREVGEDTFGFAEALRHVLRQDPDVILVGELRDHETISMALTAAETGHAVYASLHTQDAPQAIDRIIDVFPSHQQSQVRVQVASSLQGIVTQQLLPLASGHGRTVAAEVLVITPAIRNLIREAKIHQIYSSMQAGGAFGMQTMEVALAQLVRARTVTPEAALRGSSNPDELRRLLSSSNSSPSQLRRGA
ncbi:type IV pilus twitching motility protein PilT [Acidithrix ferrooxidans]|uniref:Twitching mobility protein n=1 Tax=Acidithrix ferrooxidans TaxID=1280514 RepID=A0A0D8HLC3_9ACTN|nr:type IV pilus twitching motility protein PilT [Acidithrix ferrooxidans]KJF18733.1 twitching mobility protein [Acidithrix ferrooxidans]